MTWTRINPGIMQFQPNMADTWLIVKVLSHGVTTYWAMYVTPAGLSHIGSGDTYKEAQQIVMAALDHTTMDRP